MRRVGEARNWCGRCAPGEEIALVPGDLADLVVWREAAQLAQQVIVAARRIQGVGAGAAADQLVRAGESVAANIAEAYGRGFGKDGGRFLRVARGSAAELESHLWLAEQTRRLPAPLAGELLRQTRRVRALVGGLLRSTSKQPSRD